VFRTSSSVIAGAVAKIDNHKTVAALNRSFIAW
jgi:hypothetical protein